VGKRSRVQLQRLLEDYTKIVDNEFWVGFLDSVDGESKHALRQLATESYTHEKLRYWQGFFKALNLVAHEYPARFLDEIKRELDSQ
jgi:hypothetical protein